MVMTQSVALFLIAGLFDRRWISCLAVVAEREPLEHRASGHSSPVSLWHRAHLPARPLRSRVCCLRRMVYRALDTLGRQVDRITPDRLDLVGGLIRLSGIAIIMYWPR
jgi:hypothetical protein